MNDGYACVAKGLGKPRGQRGRGHNHPIDGILAQHVHGMLGVCFIRQVHKQWAQAPILKAACEEIKDLEKDGVVKVVRDKPDQLGTPCCQRGGQRIWAVAQFAGGLFNLAPHLVGHRGPVGKGARYSRTGNTRTFCNLFQRNGHPVCLLS